MKVAVPVPQHSFRFGQRASAQTVDNPLSAQAAPSLPEGRPTLSQEGRGERGLFMAGQEAFRLEGGDAA